MLRAVACIGSVTSFVVFKFLGSHQKVVLCDNSSSYDNARKMTEPPDAKTTNGGFLNQMTKLAIGDPSHKVTVLVTGSSGFLGQHIVKMLQEHTENVKEIVLFDVKPYVNHLDHETKIPMKGIIGSITNLAELKQAFQGVDSVVHSAGAVEFKYKPDMERLESINVEGTANVIQACIESYVSRLIYTSTVDVVVGYNELNDVDESAQIPNVFLFKGYPETKYRAETLVINANGRKFGEKLHEKLQTISLRPTVMYGEEDPFYVTSGLKMAHSNGGVLPVVGNRKALFHQSYVGNVAWCHVCALSAMFKDQNLGGKVFFVTDDTPLINSFDFSEIFLKLNGCRLSTWSIPYSMAYTFLWLSERFYWLVSPIYSINPEVTLASIIYVNKTFTFKRHLVEETFGYKPLFSFEQAVKLSNGYYKTI